MHFSLAALLTILSVQLDTAFSLPIPQSLGTVEQVPQMIARASKAKSTKKDTPTVTVTVTRSVCAATSTSATLPATTTAASNTAATSTSSSSEFGSCDPPLISASNSFSDHQGIFAFEPTNIQQYPHGSALQIAIIEQFVCDNLVNKCGLKQGDAGHQKCLSAQQTVGSGTKDGALADKWNALFGVVTDFAKAAGSSSASSSSSAVSSSLTSVSATANQAIATGSSSSSEFGTCDPPLISASNSFSDHQGIFAFEPTNIQQYPHGSALQIAIIEQFVCDNLVNKCGLKQGDAGHQKCLSAQQTVGSGTKDGALADKWNALFGVVTDFAKAAGSSSASSSSAVVSATTSATANQAVATGSTSSSSSSEFGTCDPPLISASNSFSDHQGIFAFEPTNTQQYPHGSALQIAIIEQFVCDNLVNKCGLKQGDAGHQKCLSAQQTVGSGTKDGALADKWNALFGVTTEFAKAAGSTSGSSSTARL